MINVNPAENAVTQTVLVRSETIIAAADTQLDVYPKQRRPMDGKAERRILRHRWRASLSDRGLTMANVKLHAKFDTVAARNNLAQSYRTMARAMVTAESRDRLLSMAKKLENRSRKNGASPPGGED